MLAKVVVVVANMMMMVEVAKAEMVKVAEVIAIGG